MKTIMRLLALAGGISLGLTWVDSVLANPVETQIQET
jgi:hypothetical protein